ncbi:hypothetical protein M885DRAFT_500274 [Pelagophyceae sp. CCMP2097]|nr:hypothetical protein M885DRAFT_500274 [Pelagophyceae sp. CCMP2097]
MHADQERPGASIVSGSLKDMGEGTKCWTRFAAHQDFSELDLVVASRSAANRCISCRTENGHGTLREPINISDHRALVATFRFSTIRATESDEGAAFSPLPERKSRWADGSQNE